MQLRFPETEISAIAARYTYPREESELIDLRSTVQRQGHLTLAQLRRLAKWKSPRNAGRIDRNTEAYVKEISGFALSAVNERSRIESLTLLDGVLWPTASVILHLFHRENYPILDFRALWSVRTNVPAIYSFEFWTSYVKFTRRIAARVPASMRELDRALWQYSKENQPRASVA
jgi:hypothetical protein